MGGGRSGIAHLRDAANWRARSNAALPLREGNLALSEGEGAELGTLLCSLTTWSDGDDTESVDDSALWDAVSPSLMTRLVGSLRF